MEEGGGEGNVWEANLFLCVLRLVKLLNDLKVKRQTRLRVSSFDHHLTCGLPGKRGPQHKKRGQTW